MNVQLFKDDIITSANAEVAGMDYFDLKFDWDFKRAVKYVIVEDCYVDGDYIYC